MTIQIPADVRELAGWQFTAETGKQHRISTRKVVLEHGAIDAITRAIDELSLPKKAWLLADENTFKAAGDTVCQILQAGGITVRSHILRASGDYISADEENLDNARSGIWDQAELYIGVGSGVINDLTRLLAAERCEKTAYIAVATAASMNGYGSPISAFLERGVKVAKPTAGTDLIIADLDVLIAAPARLARSGFGDILAKNTANNDWYIASQITGAYYTAVPVNMVRQASRRLLQVAAKVRECDTDAIEILTGGLIVGAFAMDVTGVTAPASGGEHLISHYIDMTAHLKGYQPAMHGEQVAVGTLITSALYEKVRQVDVDAIDIDALVDNYTDDWPERQARVHSDHEDLADIVMGEVEKQMLTKNQYRQRLETIRTKWHEMWNHIGDSMIGVDEIRKAYQAAGTPTRATQIDAPPDLVRKAYLLARDIRNRYTILHLAGDLDLLDAFADEVLDRSGVLI